MFRTAKYEFEKKIFMATCPHFNGFNVKRMLVCSYDIPTVRVSGCVNCVDYNLITTT